MTETPDPKYAKYNRSAKGLARYKRYEAAHPERKERLRVGMIARDAQTRQMGEQERSSSESVQGNDQADPWG